VIPRDHPVRGAVQAQQPDRAREGYEGRDQRLGIFVCGRRHPGAWRRPQAKTRQARSRCKDAGRVVTPGQDAPKTG